MPTTVTLVPPPIGPKDGVTDVTDATPVKVKETPDPLEKSSPLRLTSRGLIPWDIAGVSHSILVEHMYLAKTSVPSKEHFIDA